MATTGKEYTLAVRIAGKIDKTFNSSLNLANSSLKKNAAVWDQTFNMLDKGYDKIVKFGRTTFRTLSRAAVVASTAIAAATVAAVNAGSEFESAFAGVKKTVEATEEEYAKLRQSILDMSKEIPSTAVEIAKVMEVAGQLGIATEHLEEFTRVMINLGVSTNLSAEEAATALAKFANITNMDSADFERLGSVIVDLGNNFATTELDIVEMATRLAASGELVGLTESQIMALATAMSSVGIAAETGGSTMSKLLKKMQVAVELESEAMNEYASIAGMTGEQFKQTFQKDAVVALSAFIDGLNDTERNGKSAIVVLNDMGLNEVRLSNTILSLANANGLMTKAVTMANKAWEENTALSEEAGKRYETMESKIQVFKNTLTNLAIAAYDELRGPLADGLDYVTDAVEEFTKYATGPNGISKWISNLQTELPTVIRNVKTFATEVLDFLGPLLNAGKWLINHPDFLAKAFIALGTALATYKIASTIHTVVKGVSSLIENIKALASSNPYVLIVIAVLIAISAAVIGIVNAMKAYEKKQKEIIRLNIAKHFGDIALSLEDIEEVAGHLVNKNGVLDELHNAIGAFDELDSIQDSIDNAITAVNKTHWKVGVGIELTDEEIANYKDSISEFVTQTQNYITQSQYALTLAVGVAYDKDDKFGTNLIEEINEFYNSVYGDLESIGTKLNQAITDAFTDGLLDIDEAKEIQDLLQQLAEIQNAIAGSNFSAALTSLSIDYGLGSGAQLNAETFKNLQAEVNEQLATFKAENNEARDKLIQNAALRYNQGFITKEEYDAEIAQIGKDFEALYAESVSTATQFLLNSIKDSGMVESAYAEAYKLAAGALESSDLLSMDISSYSAEGITSMIASLYQNSEYYIGEEFKKMQKSVDELLTQMKPSYDYLVEQRDYYKQIGEDIPDYITNGINDYEKLEELKNAANAPAQIIYDVISNSSNFEDIKRILEESGRTFDEVLATGITENKDIVTDAVKDVINSAKTEYNKIQTNGFVLQSNMFAKYGIESPFNITDIPEVKVGPYAMPGHATGGIFTVPHIAAFAEAGPEAAIPLDGSSNAINLWKRTGQLLGMGSVLDDVDLGGGNTGAHIEYKPTLVFNGGAPSQSDLESAMRTSQEEFEIMMARYLKDHGRVAFS